MGGYLIVCLRVCLCVCVYLPIVLKVYVHLQYI